MKKTLTLGLVILFVFAATYAFAGIAASKHNLSLATNTFYQTETAEICVFCHTPHGGGTTSPLWNRNNPAPAGFTMYSSTTLDGTFVYNSGKPGSVSLACLSCHDGVTAFDDIIVNPADGTKPFSGWNGGNNKITGGGNLGVDLSNDHPISITYVDSAGTGMVAKTISGSKVYVLAGSTQLPLFGTSPNYTLECGSCHAVHDPTFAPFLRKANTGSALCLGCHAK